METHRLDVISYQTGEAIESFFGSERFIDKVDSGINRQLNHDEFYTLITQLDSP